MKTSSLPSSTNNTNLLSKDYLNNVISLQNFQKPLEVISTGNINLDQSLGCNGIPKGRITEIYGGEACGKTTLALQLAKQCTDQKQWVLFIDLECSLDANYVKQLGIDLDYFYVAGAKNGENAFAIIDNALTNKQFSLIIVDSVAAMISELEYETKIEANNILGSHARLMSRGLRKIQLPLSQSKTALVFINQIREKIGIFFGNPETTTGGRALKYFASLRLEMKKIDLLKNGLDKVGIKSKVTVVKNKLAKPFQSAFISIYFGEGFNYTSDLLEFAIDHDIIEKSGSWFFYQNQNLAQGMKQLKEYASTHQEWLNEIQQRCLAIMKTNQENESEINQDLTIIQSTENENLDR